MDEVKKKKMGLDSKLLPNFNNSIKDCMGKAKTHSQNIEKLEGGLEFVEEEEETDH